MILIDVSLYFSKQDNVLFSSNVLNLLLFSIRHKYFNKFVYFNIGVYKKGYEKNNKRPKWIALWNVVNLIQYVTQCIYIGSFAILQFLQVAYIL